MPQGQGLVLVGKLHAALDLGLDSHLDSKLILKTQDWLLKTLSQTRRVVRVIKQSTGMRVGSMRVIHSPCMQAPLLELAA